jgi:hypothetical protein
MTDIGIHDIVEDFDRWQDDLMAWAAKVHRRPVRMVYVSMPDDTPEQVEVGHWTTDVRRDIRAAMPLGLHFRRTTRELLPVQDCVALVLVCGSARHPLAWKLGPEQKQKVLDARRAGVPVLLWVGRWGTAVPWEDCRVWGARVGVWVSVSSSWPQSPSRAWSAVMWALTPRLFRNREQ